MYMKTNLKAAIILSMIVLFSACSTQRQVNRVSTDEQIDLSGRWNDTDSKMTADAMIEQILGAAWVSNFTMENNNRKPVMVVGIVTNKSHEHIDAETFVKDLEKAVINNQRVKLVQAGAKREALRSERAQQQDFASASTAKKWGQELGADFILQGTINSIVDQIDNKKVVMYQIDLELSNIETNEVVWIGDKKIKKFIKN